MPFFVWLGRHRRSRMPYLGQDLNKLGIVRAVPVFDSPAKQETGLPSFMKGESVIAHNLQFLFVQKTTSLSY